MTSSSAPTQKSPQRMGIADLQLVAAPNPRMAGGRDKSISAENPHVDDKASLLNQLRIDRTEEPEPQNDRTTLWVGVAVATLVAAFAVYWFGFRSTGVPIKVATAREIAPAAASRGASTLDASG